jgi:hypothetical protein
LYSTSLLSLGPDDSSPTILEHFLQYYEGPPLLLANGFADIPEFLLSAETTAISTISTSALLAHVVPAASKRFQFDPSDKLKETTLKREVRARANREPAFAQSLARWFDAWTAGTDQESHSLDIFHCLWPYYTDAMTPTPETRLALGVVGLMAGLATVAPCVLALLARAPTRPNYEFHMVNALLSVIKYTVKPTPKDERAAGHLLTQALKKVASFALVVPDVGRPEFSNKSPFPKLDVFLRSFIDLLACTPRLIADFFCTGVKVQNLSDESLNHRFGYRLYGDLADALRVAPDEEDTLDEILSQFESEHDAPAHCNEKHPFDQHEHAYSYTGRGPPPMLFFEAAARQGIPRACIVPEVVLTECTLQGVHTEYPYALVAVVSVHSTAEHFEDDLSLEFYAPGAPYDDSIPNLENAAVALVVYARLAGAVTTNLLARLTCAERGEEKMHEESEDDEGGEEKEEDDEEIDSVDD